MENETNEEEKRKRAVAIVESGEDYLVVPLSRMSKEYGLGAVYKATADELNTAGATLQVHAVMVNLGIKGTGNGRANE